MKFGIRAGDHLADIVTHELPVRPKEVYDGAIPSANAVALHNLIELNCLTADDRWLERAGKLIQAFGGSLRKQPTAYLHTLSGWELLLNRKDRCASDNRSEKEK